MLLIKIDFLFLLCRLGVWINATNNIIDPYVTWSYQCTCIVPYIVYWCQINLRYCSDVCSGTTCHKGNEISSGRNDYLPPQWCCQTICTPNGLVKNIGCQKTDKYSKSICHKMPPPNTWNFISLFNTPK